MNSNNLSVQVENISKRYRIGTKIEKHDTFAKSLYGLVKSPIKNYRKHKSLYKFSKNEDLNSFLDDESKGIVWALRGISFNIKKGEVVGIIGTNGAGKSTLLKILSKITHPTGGRAILHGKTTSLLEVGTGFHPELTGRENIYLNGTILGMRKNEVDKKFDQIIDFSGVEKFIDTPVKRYSSGMTVRLAFSVAAHLEPDILIIDEVLAVGDIGFQKKCLTKMENVSNQGRTILFVSHNMQAVTRLCKRTILLDNGNIFADGPSNQIIPKYLSGYSNTKAELVYTDGSKSPGGDIARLIAIRVRRPDGKVADSVYSDQKFCIDMEYEVLAPERILVPHHHIFNIEGIQVFSTFDTDAKWSERPRPKGKFTSTVWIPGNLLNEGQFSVSSGLITLNPAIVQFYQNPAVAFTILGSREDDSVNGDIFLATKGVIRPHLEWTSQYEH